MKYSLLAFLTILTLINFSRAFVDNKEEDDNEVLIELACMRCKDVADKFTQELESTENSTYIGGNFEWEAKSLNTYEDSEARLFEILEKLCVKNPNESKCYRLLEENEEIIEEYWNNERKNNVTFYDHICIEKLQICCPLGHYGPNCDPCPGLTAENRACNGFGTCRGGDSKSGNGECSCASGYMGVACEECTSTYYRDEFGSCISCHSSCKGNCTGPSEADCPADNCVDGYIYNNVSKMCEDINECLDPSISNCAENQFCHNQPSTFSCLDCNRACNGCNGPSAKDCIECSKDYHLEDEYCKRDDGKDDDFDFDIYNGSEDEEEDDKLDESLQKKLSVFKNKKPTNSHIGHNHPEHSSGVDKSDDQKVDSSQNDSQHDKKLNSKENSETLSDLNKSDDLDIKSDKLSKNEDKLKEKNFNDDENNEDVNKKKKDKKTKDKKTKDEKHKDNKNKDEKNEDKNNKDMDENKKSKKNKKDKNEKKDKKENKSKDSEKNKKKKDKKREKTASDADGSEDNHLTFQPIGSKFEL